MSLSERLNYALGVRKMTQADVVRKVSHLLEGENAERRFAKRVSTIATGAVENPTLDAVILIAKGLDVSLDWLVGRKDSPAFISDEEAKSLVEKYQLLPRDDRQAIVKQIDFMLSENAKKEVSDHSVSEIA